MATVSNTSLMSKWSNDVINKAGMCGNSIKYVADEQMSNDVINKASMCGNSIKYVTDEQTNGLRSCPGNRIGCRTPTARATI